MSYPAGKKENNGGKLSMTMYASIFLWKDQEKSQCLFVSDAIAMKIHFPVS